MMPIYDYRCPHGHVFEKMTTIAARARQDCPVCGQPSGKIPSRVFLGGRADPGPPMEQMPQTWRGTYEGNPEYLGRLRRQWEARRKLEDSYEELRGDRRPVLAHEGRYHAAPLRAGDPPTGPPAALAAGHDRGAAPAPGHRDGYPPGVHTETRAAVHAVPHGET
jgi:putative FmdB family regulatory protein